MQAVEKWADAEVERKGLKITKHELLRESGLLGLIRFPTMTSKEFADGPSTSGILTQEEVITLFQWFCASVKPAHVGFNTKPR